ncbi:MAG: hypothetical protein HOW73_21680 [Polyangiaceae bacterium]|nr:hypothetical protein [Polyangiaceae bacterium]
MIRQLLGLGFLVALVGCSGSQSATEEEPPAASAAVATSDPHSGHEAGTADAVPTSGQPETTASAMAQGDHASGSPKCDELAKACHDVGHGDDELGKCHQLGHAGDAAVCEKEHDRCVKLCKAAAEKGAHSHAH